MTADRRRTSRHAAAPERRPGDGLVRAGAVVFVVGVVAVVAAVVPSVLTGDPGQTTLVVLAGSLLPIGLGIALLGLLRAARTGRRAAKAERRAARRTTPRRTTPRRTAPRHEERP